MKLSKRILSIILALVTVVTMCVGMTFTAQAAPSKPAGVKATSTSSSTIKLTWKKSSGATGYYIYRSTSKTKNFKKIATIKKVSTVSYTNSGLSSSKTYYYKIKSYKGSSASAYSATVSAKTKDSWRTAAKNLIYYFPNYGFDTVDANSSIEVVDLNSDGIPEILFANCWRANDCIGGVYYYKKSTGKYVSAGFSKESFNSYYPILPTKGKDGKKIFISNKFPSYSQASSYLDMIYRGHASYYLAYESCSMKYTFSNNKLTYKTFYDLTSYIYEVEDGDYSAKNTYLSKLTAFNNNYKTDTNSKYVVVNFYGNGIVGAGTKSAKLKLYQQVITKTVASNIISKYDNKTHTYNI